MIVMKIIISASKSFLRGETYYPEAYCEQILLLMYICGYKIIDINKTLLWFKENPKPPYKKIKG